LKKRRPGIQHTLPTFPVAWLRPRRVPKWNVKCTTRSNSTLKSFAQPVKKFRSLALKHRTATFRLSSGPFQFLLRSAQQKNLIIVVTAKIITRAGLPLNEQEEEGASAGASGNARI